MIVLYKLHFFSKISNKTLLKKLLHFIAETLNFSLIPKHHSLHKTVSHKKLIDARMSETMFDWRLQVVIFFEYFKGHLKSKITSLYSGNSDLFIDTKKKNHALLSKSLHKQINWTANVGDNFWLTFTNGNFFRNFQMASY